MLKPLIIASLAIAAASPAIAETTLVSANPAPKAKSKDPNRRVCEKVERIGSRLGGTTICMTAQQWEDKRREERTELERVQRNTAIPIGN